MKTCHSCKDTRPDALMLSVVSLLGSHSFYVCRPRPDSEDSSRIRPCFRRVVCVAEHHYIAEVP